ncbi:GNAT family N-acetyltransferase [Rhizobium sp. GR12]|uniref:GNAT family N-acetyltransferase n=1 Tax=Rhizobium sp. GR12 TaxID=3053925 RepID=UPI002FBF168B
MDHQGDMRRGIVTPATPREVGGMSGPVVYRAFNLHGRGPVEVYREGRRVLVSDADGAKAVFLLSTDDNGGQIEVGEVSAMASGTWRLAAAAFECLFSTSPALRFLTLSGNGWAGLKDEFTAQGLYAQVRSTSTPPAVWADMFWQTPGLWTAPVTGLFPRHDIHDGRVSHPLRPPKPVGAVYARFIPWLGGVLSLDVATLDDLPEVHSWMNSPRVNEFWHEAGDEDRHSRYLEGMFADEHIMPLMGRFDGRPFSYFEVYWAKEDVVGSFCDASDYDRGCHVIVGDETCRGRNWFTAWLPSLLHYMFIDDPRTERIVQEPSSNHHRQLRNLQKSGFSHVKSVDLPTKHAAIMAIGRQRFFSDRLWHPAM